MTLQRTIPVPPAVTYDLHRAAIRSRVALADSRESARRLAEIRARMVDLRHRTEARRRQTADRMNRSAGRMAAAERLLSRRSA